MLQEPNGDSSSWKTLMSFIFSCSTLRSFSIFCPENLWKYRSRGKQKYQFLKFLVRIVVVVSKPEIKRKKFLLFSQHKTERKIFLFWSQSMRLKDRNSRSRLETRDWNKFLLLSQSTGQKEICILISKHKTERKKFLFSSRSTRRKKRNSCSHHESLKQLLIGHCMVQTPAATWWLCFPHHLTSCCLGFALTLPNEWISPGFAIKAPLDLLTLLPVRILQGPTTLILRISAHFGKEKYMSNKHEHVDYIAVELYLWLNCVRSNTDYLKWGLGNPAASKFDSSHQ